MNSIYCYKQGTPLQLLAVIDDYVSFSFTRSLSGFGRWELVLSANSLNSERIEGMDFISVGDGVAGIVKKVDKYYAELNNTITYSGIELKGLALGRIVIPPTGSDTLSFNNKTPEYIIAQLLNTQMVNPTQVSRKIINTSIAAYTAVKTPITKEYRFKNIGDVIEELATAYGIGWYANIESGNIVFHIYNGVNRTKAQSVNDKLVVSYDRDSIESSRYMKNKQQPTTALVAGQGEGVDRTITMLNDELEDINRNEVYVDARDISEAEQLPARGYEKLKSFTEENIYRISLGKILIDAYKENYDLGDIGTVEDDIMGSAMDFQLTEITEVYENNVFTLEVVFGLDRTTITALLKRNNQLLEAMSAIEGSGGGGDYLPSSGGTISGALNVTGSLTAAGLTVLDSGNVGTYAAAPTHNHTKANITDFPTTMTPTAHNHAKADITDFPTSMTPTSHTHGNITNGGLIGTTASIPIITGTGGILQAGSFGTAAGTFCQGNDGRLADARTPTAHTHGNITSGGLIGTTASIPIITGTGGILQAGSFGTAVGTFCQGNDTRLADARTPTSHTHGNITNAGLIGTTASLPIITGTGGKLQAGSFGNTAGTFCQGNDGRLADARTPTTHSHAIADLPTITIAKGGTGATTAAGALTALGFTATATELNYTDGVTSAIQTQLNAKQKAFGYGATLPASGMVTGDYFIKT